MARAAEVSTPEAIEPVERAPVVSVLAVADTAPSKVEPAKAESTIANAQLAVGTDKDTAAGDAFLAAAKDLKKGTPLTEAERAAAALGDLMRTADQRSRGIGSPEILPGGLARVKYDPAQRADKLEALVSGKIKDGNIAVRTYAERPDGLKGERVVVTPRGQETVRVYDPAKSRDGIAQLQTVRQGDKVAVTADYRGRVDGLLRETLTADPSGSTRIRTYSDGRREETRVGPDKKPETKYFGGDNRPIALEQFQAQQKSLLEANQKRRAAGEPLINEQEVRAQPAEQATRLGPPLPGEGIKLPPLKAGWGPYQAIEQANREHKLGMTPQQVKEAAVRIRDRETQERGNTAFRQGERLDFYTPGELAKKGRPLDGRTPGADNPVLKPGERRTAPVDGAPIAEKPLERNTNLEQRLNTFNSILKSDKPLTAEEADVFRRQLRDLSPAEIQQLRKLHDPSKPENFDKALRDKFATLPEGQDRHAHRWAEIEGHLKRTGKPGEDAAIQLRVDALEAKWAGYDGNRTFTAIQANTRGTLLNATQEQRKGIDTALSTLYGQGGLSEFYEKGPGKNLTYNGNSWYSGEDKFTKSVLELTTKKGVDARTPQEQTALLDLALQEKSVDRFREVSNKAAMTPEGRAHFFRNGGLEKINAKINKDSRSDVRVFSEVERRELTDLAQKGEESPLTQFKKAIGILSNTDTALADAVKRVAENPVQQELYLNGRQLAREKREPKTESERAALEFYTELNKTFKSAHVIGSERKAQNFDAQIANGTRGALSNGRLGELGSSWWQHSSDLFKAIEGASPEQLNALFDGARLDNGRPQSRGLDDARKSIHDNTNRQVNADRLNGLQDRKVAYGIELGQIADQIKDTPHGKPLDPKLIQQLQERVPAFKGLPQEKVQQVVDGYRLDLAVRSKSVDAAKLSKPEQQQLAAYRSLDAAKSPQESQLKGFLQGREIQRNIDGILNKPDQLDGTRNRLMNEYMQTLKPQDIGSLDMFRAIRNDAVQTNVRRELKEALGDAKDGAAVIDALKNATPAERRRMKDEPQYAKEMLDLAQRTSTNPESRLASKILLDSYANDRPLTPGEKATLSVVEKVAAVNGDFRDRQKAAIEALQQSLRLDKDGSLAKELAGSEQFRQAMQAALGTDQFRRGMPGGVGAQLSYDAMIKPLLERGSVPVEQLQRLYGKGTAEFFKAAVLDATPQGLKYLKSAEGESERRAVLGALTADGQALAQKILQQGEVKPQDRLRAFVVGLDKQESAIDFLKTTPAKERVEAIRGYNREFKGNLQEDLLKKVDETAKPTVTLLAAENQLTGSQAVVRSRELVTSSTETFLGGQALKYDSTVFRSLTDLALAERQYKGQIPPSVMDMRIKAIAADLKNFDGTKEQIADALIEAGITVAAVAATPFTGGASLTALMLATRIAAMSTLGGGVGALTKGYLRGNYEHLYGDALKFGILTGANLLTGESLAVFTRLGSRAAASTVEKTLATPALNGVLKEVSPAVREQLEKGLADLIQKGVTAGGVKDDAVRALVGSVNGLTKETQQALAQGLINNLGGSIREVSTAGIRGTLDRLGRTSGNVLRDGFAAGTGGFTGTIAEQLAEGRAVDLQQALLSGATNFFVGSAARGTIESIKAARAASRSGRLESFEPGFDRSVPAIVEPAERGVGPARTARGPRDGRVIDLDPHEYRRIDDPAGLVEGPPAARRRPGRQELSRLDVPQERLRLPAPAEIAKLKVEVPDEFGFIREFEVAGKKERLFADPQGWFFKTPHKEGELIAPVKIHVTTSGPEDLGRIQAVLLPHLFSDPELSALIKNFKTYDPLHGIGELSNYAAPNGKGQGAKAFTIYAKDPTRAAEVQARIDKILADNGLSLPVAHPTGNVDIIAGRSNRVGIVRDAWEGARSIDGRVGVVLDKDLTTAVYKHLGIPEGTKLSPAQLTQIEKYAEIMPGTLSHDLNGRLMLKSFSKRSDWYPTAGEGAFYLDESRALKGSNQATDRPAYYALSHRFNLNPASAL